MLFDEKSYLILLQQLINKLKEETIVTTDFLVIKIV